MVEKTQMVLSFSCRRGRCTKQFWKIILLGQVMALANAALGTFNSCLTVFTNVSLPIFLSLLTYVMFFPLWVLPSVHRVFVTKRIDIVWFLIVGLIDLTANAMSFTAYNFTSTAAVQMLINLSTPTALLFCACIRRQRFSWQQILMAMLATGSSIAFTYVDTIGQDNGENYKGDLLAAMAGTLFGLESVINEFITVDYNNVQWLARMCPSAIVLSLILFFGIEFDAVVSGGMLRDPVVWAYIVGFLLSIFVFYLLIPWMVGHAGAMIFNISLLPQNIYSFITSIFLFHFTYSYWIILPSILILLSLVLYFISPASDYCCSVKPRSVREAERVARAGVGTKTSASTVPQEQSVVPQLSLPESRRKNGSNLGEDSIELRSSSRSLHGSTADLSEHAA